MCMCMFVYRCMYVCMYVFMCVFIYVCMYVCMHHVVCINIYVNMCVHKCGLYILVCTGLFGRNFDNLKCVVTKQGCSFFGQGQWRRPPLFWLHWVPVPVMCSFWWQAHRMFKAFCNVHFCMILYVMTYSTSSCLVTKLWIHGMYICMYICMYVCKKLFSISSFHSRFAFHSMWILHERYSHKLHHQWYMTVKLIHDVYKYVHVSSIADGCISLLN